MSDVKEDYSNSVKERKEDALKDYELAESIQKGYDRKKKFGDDWETVDINDVVNVIAPGAKPIISGSKIIYYSADKTKAVVADISGYLRVQDLTKKTKKRRYLDKYGNDAHNTKDPNGKTRGRTKDEFQRATHYIIKKRKRG